MPSKPESWAERQEAVRGILAHELVRSQSQLVRKLRARGFSVTQSSVSRDLTQLRCIKVDGRYVAGLTLLAPAAPSDELLELAGSIVRFRAAGPYLLVVQTPAGRAPAVSMAVDRAQWPEVVGTVAGDDTFFIATAGRRDQARIESRLQRLTLARARHA